METSREQNEDAVAFFKEHAGWSYDPPRETPEQGRRRGAEDLALAEQWLRDSGLTVQWEDDWFVGSHQAEYGEAYAEGEPERCEQASIVDDQGNYLASLGCIDGATAEYRRVIEAELALEAMTSFLAVLTA